MAELGPLERLIRLPNYGGGQRFTQDTPILPDVWMKFAALGREDSLEFSSVELLLSPHYESSASKLSQYLIKHLEILGRSRWGEEAGIAYTESFVCADLVFEELLTCALPLTQWWANATYSMDSPLDQSDSLNTLAFTKSMEESSGEIISLWRTLIEGQTFKRPISQIQHFQLMCMAILGQSPNNVNRVSQAESLFGNLHKIFIKKVSALAKAKINKIDNLDFGSGMLWGIALNRPAELAVSQSRKTVKADAAKQVFGGECDEIRWVVIDSGIDAAHPAFTDYSLERPRGEKFHPSFSRVVETYDFTRLKPLLIGGAVQLNELAEQLLLSRRQASSLAGLKKILRGRLRSGLQIDWGLLTPILRVPHAKNYYRPFNSHGTHVAGILGGGWDRHDSGADFPIHFDDERDICGICPDIRLYDFRVFDKENMADEFTILAAMQFIRFLNGQSGKRLVHGVNLSISIKHDVRNFACGRTPVCEEAERLVKAGVVVVAAAGNYGLENVDPNYSFGEGYRAISITDPGNADSIITVGATHRNMPHAFGVSYFSSRGPTGDGRAKPDLLAPGEKIRSLISGVYDDLEERDGTSMAAPHVSGVAALLMARHPELIGDPVAIKKILCETATDLGRDKYFQGHGLVDAFRAIQSV